MTDPMHAPVRSRSLRDEPMHLPPAAAVNDDPGDRKDSIFVGALWMIGITLALFFVPAVNGLVGGLVGGYRVGSVNRAVTAALLPAVVVALALTAFLALWNLPVLGVFAGLTAAVLVVLADLGLLLGALAGGWLASSRRRRVGQR